MESNDRTALIALKHFVAEAKGLVAMTGTMPEDRRLRCLQCLKAATDIADVLLTPAKDVRDARANIRDDEIADD